MKLLFGVLLAVAPIIGSGTPALAAKAQPGTAAADEERYGKRLLAGFDKSLTRETRQAVDSAALVLHAMDAAWLEDSFPGDPALVEPVFLREYERVRRLSLRPRIQFFWLLMLHFQIGTYAHLSGVLATTLAQDCGQEMDRTLEKLIAGADRQGTLRSNEVGKAKAWRRTLASYLPKK